MRGYNDDKQPGVVCFNMGFFLYCLAYCSLYLLLHTKKKGIDKMTNIDRDERLSISNCYLRDIITRQSAFDLLILIGHSLGKAELILLFIDILYKKKGKG